MENGNGADQKERGLWGREWKQDGYKGNETAGIVKQ